MANPRKFIDKIALHTQKQAEETAAFEAIIKEVSTTKKPATQQVQPHLQHLPVQHHLQLIQPNFGNCRGRSLPNVNQVANNSIDLQSALSNLEDIRQVVSGHSLTPDKHRGRGQQTQKKFSVDRHRDCSPYGSVSYLSPPPDTSWRRASSDSALHLTVQGGTTYPYNGCGVVMTNGQADGNLLQVSHVSEMEGIQMWDSNGLRPRSCEVPGISIYSSPDPSSSTASILISSNTGSLPDLANLDFPSPLTAPLDTDVPSRRCSSRDGGILESRVSPINITLQLYQQLSEQQQQQQRSQAPGLPLASTGIQRHMAPAPLVLQGSNSFIAGGGNAVLAQDSSYVPLIRNKPIPDSRSPPAYSSFHLPTSSPLSPPSITLTDITQNGAPDKILYSEFEPENRLWCDSSSGPSTQTHRLESSSSGCAQKFTEVNLDSLAMKDCAAGPKHRQTPLKSNSEKRNGFSSSSVNSNRVSFNDIEMQNGTLKENCESVNMDENESQNKSLGMAQYRGTSCDGGPQSPISPLSQLSSSYSPSQSPGTSASMASSPQMTDTSYQLDVTMAQMQHAVSQQLGQNSGNKSPQQLTQQLKQQQTQQQLTQQQIQQLTRFVGKTMIPSESLQHKFQQIKIADNINACNELNLRTAAKQQLQQQQQLQLQQHQAAAAATALMSSGNLVFMRTSNNQPQVGSFATNNFYQPHQSVASQQQQQQQPMRQQVFQSPYVASNQGLVATSNQSIQFPHDMQELTSSSNANALPDIVLTGDLSLYANQDIMDIKNTGSESILTSSISSSQSDWFSRDGINLLTYLGESFDADMLTADDFLKIGLDPLELEEIRMLSDTNIVTDPAIEDSFRLDRM